MLALLLLAGCAAAPAGRPAPAPLTPVRAAPALDPPPETPEEREVHAALGPEAVEAARAAPSSVVAIFRQGMPRPIVGPDGRTTFAGPAVNLAVHREGGWRGWKTRRPEPLPAAVAARLDSILADPALWREPGQYAASGCTDAGSFTVVIRHQGRRKMSRQDNCRSRGLAGELGRIVLNEALGAPW